MKSARARKLNSMHIVVDKFHFKTHNDKTCKKYCNPNKFEEIINMNTSVAEQVNYWLSKFKHNVKHMNFERFNFFIFVICDLYNKLKLNMI